MGTSPITFGLENISVFDEYGNPLLVYSETEILNLIRKRARAKAERQLGPVVVPYPISHAIPPAPYLTVASIFIPIFS